MLFASNNNFCSIPASELCLVYVFSYLDSTMKASVPAKQLVCARPDPHPLI